MPYRHGENKHKQVVKLEYACYICGDILSAAKVVIDHVKRIHGIEIPSRQVGRNRPSSKEYEYLRDSNGDFDLLHYSCASCWYHCPETDLTELRDHYVEEHNPKNVSSGRNRNKNQNDSDEYYVRASDEEEDGNSQKTSDVIMGKLEEITELIKGLLK